MLQLQVQQNDDSIQTQVNRNYNTILIINNNMRQKYVLH